MGAMARRSAPARKYPSVPVRATAESCPARTRSVQVPSAPSSAAMLSGPRVAGRPPGPVRVMRARVPVASETSSTVTVVCSVGVIVTPVCSGYRLPTVPGNDGPRGSATGAASGGAQRGGQRLEGELDLPGPRALCGQRLVHHDLVDDVRRGPRELPLDGRCQEVLLGHVVGLGERADGAAHGVQALGGDRGLLRPGPRRRRGAGGARGTARRVLALGQRDGALDGGPPVAAGLAGGRAGELRQGGPRPLAAGEGGGRGPHR